MTTDAVEGDVRGSAAQWAFIQRVETIDKTDFTIKQRLYVDAECFVQVYVYGFSPEGQLRRRTDSGPGPDS